MTNGPVRIVFHGATAAPFADGFAPLLDLPADIRVLPERLAGGDLEAYRDADVLVTFRYDGSEVPRRLSLLHVPGAGVDAVSLDRVPASAVVCNCFGHEQAIAEYVMAALLMLHIPMVRAEAQLRRGDWRERGAVGPPHGELAGTTIGIVGFGRIGKAVAARAKAFEMTVHVANRTPVAGDDHVDRAFGFDQLAGFWPTVDAVVIALPLVPETRGLVGAAAFSAMKPGAYLVNVGRGAVVDEQALYDALKTNRVAGAAIDVWYRYPTPQQPIALPSALPFHELTNVVMTPHFSGWSTGTVRRRQRVMADNIMRRMNNERCEFVVRAAS